MGLKGEDLMEVGLMMMDEDGTSLVVMRLLLLLRFESGEEKKQKSAESHDSPWIMTTYVKRRTMNTRVNRNSRARMLFGRWIP